MRVSERKTQVDEVAAAMSVVLDSFASFSVLYLLKPQANELSSFQFCFSLLYLGRSANYFCFKYILNKFTGIFVCRWEWCAKLAVHSFSSENCLRCISHECMVLCQAHASLVVSESVKHFLYVLCFLCFVFCVLMWRTAGWRLTWRRIFGAPFNNLP